MTRRPGTESSEGLDRPPPSGLPPFNLSQRARARASSPLLLLSLSSPFPRSSPGTPRRRPSYSFVRPNFYERLPARESRNCLFSGTPGIS